jgi:hypothetical protein
MLHPPPDTHPTLQRLALSPCSAVLMAEIVHYFFPRLVELHNYSPAHNSVQKMYNWTTLNQRVRLRPHTASCCPACPPPLSG